jgi:arginine/ornithine N-succinyltransferase beta subunit
MGWHLVANRWEENFRAALAWCNEPEMCEHVSLAPEVLRGLGVAPGDSVLCVRL